MTARQNGAGTARAVRRHVLRLVYLLFIFSFLLPYVDVLGCSSKKLETVYGWQLVKGGPAGFYVVALALFAAMLALSFYGKEISRSLGAFGAAWRGMAAAVAGFIIWLMPGIQFLFDNVYMLAGQLLGVVCVALVFADSMVVAARGYVLLRGEAISTSGAALPPALAKLHWIAVIISLTMVPFYIYSLRDEIPLAVMYVLFLTIPFVLSQAIVIQGVRRGERWTLRCTPAVAVLLVGAIAVIILSYF